MISERARQGLDGMLRRALAQSEGVDDSAVSVLDTLGDIAGSQAVMLSISSFSFRVMVFLHFEPGRELQSRVAGALGVAPEELSAQALLDAVCEQGNLVCGAFNRELCRSFPFVGMSTPHCLDGRCIEHLRLLGQAHLRHFRAERPDRPPCHVTLCVCADGDIDFEPPALVAEQASGELEFF